MPDINKRQINSSSIQALRMMAGVIKLFLIKFRRESGEERHDELFYCKLAVVTHMSE